MDGLRVADERDPAGDVCEGGFEQDTGVFLARPHAILAVVLDNGIKVDQENHEKDHCEVFKEVKVELHTAAKVLKLREFAV